ncbi:hypothetical protein J5N97_003981 [Dioscorea zingiberensis]|uniref:2-oxoglutarate-dependent dioxygenase DAO n=1 Tax=Dioscorea zingiberensis TaxID=325984 RepID=A0A9D5D574_9LILI|nr:hypothetical protein J5N97_003981 [Dioscorea zingiberensis]
MGSGPQAAKIDFSGLDPASPGSKGWAEVRAQVVDALVSYGWFEAVYDKVRPELKESLFGSAMKELFGLPLDAKLRNISDKPFHGYLGQIPYLSYESLAVAQPHDPHAVKDFADILWPQGRPANICETVSSFSKLLAELDQMVHRMVLESFGAEKHYEPHMKTNKLLLRLSEYPAQLQGDGEKKIGLVPHRDKNTLAIICQNQVDGLEMETKDGQWVLALPSSTSFIVIAGDTLRAWTNGRIYSPLHSINVGGNVTRYSTILFSMPEDDLVIEPMPELVDESHPSLFKPYAYPDYVGFCMSEEGMKAKNQLDAYCGVAAES